MGRRQYEQLPWYLNWSCTWGKPGIGRWGKRRLSKVRRRFARQVCRTGERAYRHMGSLQHWEGEINWKFR